MLIFFIYKPSKLDQYTHSLSDDGVGVRYFNRVLSINLNLEINLVLGVAPILSSNIIEK